MAQNLLCMFGGFVKGEKYLDTRGESAYNGSNFVPKGAMSRPATAARDRSVAGDRGRAARSLPCNQ